jgi:hypothetical protein
MNAVERFLAGSRTDDIATASAALAPDVLMLNPATDEATVGREAVTAALSAVKRSCDEFRHTHLLAISALPSERPGCQSAGVDTSRSGNPLFGLVFEARIDESTLRGVDLVEIDETLDQISTFTVLARPLSALMAFGARMSDMERPATMTIDDAAD